MQDIQLRLGQAYETDDLEEVIECFLDFFEGDLGPKSSSERTAIEDALRGGIRKAKIDNKDVKGVIPLGSFLAFVGQTASLRMCFHLETMKYVFKFVSLEASEVDPL